MEHYDSSRYDEEQGNVVRISPSLVIDRLSSDVGPCCKILASVKASCCRALRSFENNMLQKTECEVVQAAGCNLNHHPKRPLLGWEMAQEDPCPRLRG